MDMTNKLTNKTSEEKMQRDLKAGASEEETLSDHYVILRSLGKGNFAEVKLAYHLPTEVQVAIKVLPNGKKNDFGIKTEIDIYKTLDHPYIVKLFHIINTKEYTYMVLEHAARGDLVSHIERVGRLQEKQAQHIFTQLVCAVHYCHENGIAHRDIKLDNILLDDKGNIKLCDFGLATRVTPGQGTKGFCGTLEYCAPELFSDREYDAKAVDIWSMGVVLYTMVTASFPFKADTYSDMKEEMLDPKYHLPYTLSQNVANIIVQLFTVEPEKRPQICDIRQHQWLKEKEECWKITPSLEALWNNLNPSVVVAMWRMGYQTKDISACLREKKFNNVMATYLILNHESLRSHDKHAANFLQAWVAMSPGDALTGVQTQRGLSEIALPTLLEEHQVHDEKGSRKKRMRSLSMPATLCLQQKGNKRPPPAPKISRKVTYIKSRSWALDGMICNCSSSRYLSSESVSSASYLTCETPQEVNTSNNSSYTQSSGSYREVPHIVNPTATYNIQRDSPQATSKKTFDVPPEGIPEIQRSSGWEKAKNSFDDVPPEGIPEIQTSSGWEKSKKSFDDGSSEDITEIQKSSLREASKNSSEDVPSEDMSKMQRWSFQATSNNSLDDVPPEGIPEIQITSLQESSKKSFANVPPEDLPENQRSFLQETSKNSYDDVLSQGTPEIQTTSLQETSKNSFDDVPPEDIPEIQTSFLQEKPKNSFEFVIPEEIPEIQRSSLPTTSKKSSDDVPSKGVTAVSASRLSRGWKRVKKRIGNCLRLLCCCVPACKRSHVSQKEVEAVEVESSTVTYMQPHGVPKMHYCVS